MLGHRMPLSKYWSDKLDPAFVLWATQTLTSNRKHYGHWSVGCYDQNFKDYQETVEDAANANPKSQAHSSILVSKTPPAYGTVQVGSAHLVRNASPSQDLSGHTYLRNTNAWATDFAAMFNGTTEDLGPYAPTPDEIELFIQVSITDHINMHVHWGNFLFHWEAANNMDFDSPTDPNAPGVNAGTTPYGPGFGCIRWDGWCWIDPVSFLLVPRSKPCPDGWMDFGDFIRGSIAVGIQKLTEAKWKLPHG